jgi:hypothetical protein
MTIETKYNMGDEVWCLDLFDNPQKGEITSIHTFNNQKREARNYISYFIYPFGNRTEEEIFRTKEELLKSL